MTTKTAIEEEGIFYLRPLFYPNNGYEMKYNLSSSNFKVTHETYLNSFHPYYNGGGPIIFDHAMIVDGTTGKTIRENEKLNPGTTSVVFKYIKLIFLFQLLQQ